MDRMLTAHAEEDGFAVGDALLFDKYVIHRSVPLGEGPIETRPAFVMRFVEVGSRYDRTRAENLEFPVTRYGYKAFTQSHLFVGKESGEIIDESDFFDRRHDRLVG